MSAISQETQKSLWRQVVQATEEAARREGATIDADALAVLSQPDLLFVVAPVAGLEKLAFRDLLEGSEALNDRPVMYWHLSGDALAGGARGARGPIPAGFYTVVADQKQGEARLVDASGATAARGDLTVVIGPPPPTGTSATAKTGITSVKFGKRSIKVCGEVSVSVGPATVKVTACVEVKW